MYFTDKSNVRTYIHVLPLPRMNRIIVIVTLLRITSSFRHPKNSVSQYKHRIIDCNICSLLHNSEDCYMNEEIEHSGSYDDYQEIEYFFIFIRYQVNRFSMTCFRNKSFICIYSC